jgi:hypothetical protein
MPRLAQQVTATPVHTAVALADRWNRHRAP